LHILLKTCLHLQKAFPHFLCNACFFIQTCKGRLLIAGSVLRFQIKIQETEYHKLQRNRESKCPFIIYDLRAVIKQNILADQIHIRDRKRMKLQKAIRQNAKYRTEILCFRKHTLPWEILKLLCERKQTICHFFVFSFCQPFIQLLF